MKETDGKFLSRISITLFTIGLLVPFIIGNFSSLEIAIGFGVVCEVLALVFGLLTWNQKLGKISTIGVSVLMLISAFNFVIFSSMASNEKEDVKKRMIEAQKEHQNRIEAEKKGLSEPTTN